MIIANLATYPPRASNLLRAIAAIAPQVDRLNVVLNQYETAPEGLRIAPNVELILPEEDTKDVGKFYPDTGGADYVFLVDDDIIYPQDFVIRTVAALKALGPSGYMAGYHGSLYQRPIPKLQIKSFKRFLRYWLYPGHIASYRKVYGFDPELESPPGPLVVDQLGSGVAIMHGADMPTYAYMRSSQKFVDVRLAKWCFEKGIAPVVLPHPEGWLIGVAFNETIHRSFTTTNPRHVADDIRTYAYKVVGRGQPPSLKTALAEKPYMAGP